MKHIYSTLLLLCLALTATAQNYAEYTKFPEPAAGSYSVIGTALPDGRLLLWNGNDVYVQIASGVDGFTRIATGYAGDPGFIALAPNGHEVLLGQGFGGSIYSFDVNAPVDYSPAALLTTLDHYSATFLSETLVLIDAGLSDFTGSELVMLDLSSTKGASLRSVIAKDETYQSDEGDKSIVVKPLFGWSAKLAYDDVHDVIYAMDSGARELRRFDLADILNAFNTSTPLDWATDGELVGAPADFYSGGVAGIRPDGTLIIDGSEGFLLPGGIQLVDPSVANPALASVIETLDPAGTNGFYAAIYNPYTDAITAIADGVPFGEEEELAPMTVSSAVAMGLLVLLLAGFGVGRLRRNEYGRIQG